MAGATLSHQSNTYEIRVKGHIDKRRVTMLEMQVAYHKNGETTLHGTIPDQAALYGILNRLHDLGVVLLSVNLQPQHSPIFKRGTVCD